MLLETIESALATPVQTAVRREDEQEFARLNGENPMYCEDAVRRIRAALDAWEGLALQSMTSDEVNQYYASSVAVEDDASPAKAVSIKGKMSDQISDQISMKRAPKACGCFAPRISAYGSL